MKIGIFGDSYANGTIKENQTPMWSMILEKKYGHTVDNFGMSGSNLYYSINELNRVATNEYDRIILIVTRPSRIMIPNNIQVRDPSLRFMTNVLTGDKIDLSRVKNESAQYRKFIKAAAECWLLNKDAEYEQYIHNLMLSDIKNKFKNIILIPGFPNSIPDSKYSIFDIYCMENSVWDVRPNAGYDPTSTIDLFYDIRNCHMTEENNIIFADKAEEWIRGKPPIINLKDFVYPKKESKNFYLREKRPE